MNVCHELKTILWLPPRTASRSIAPLFHKYNFLNGEYNTHISGYNNYTHALSIPKGCEDYEIICTVRNPYSWLLSIWHWDNFYEGVAEKDRISFATYVERQQWELTDISKHLLHNHITYPIRYEFIKDDLRRIPWYDYDENEINLHINKNYNKSENLKRLPENTLVSDYMAHYTQKELDTVKNKLLPLFKRFGYIIAATLALLQISLSLSTA